MRIEIIEGPQSEPITLEQALLNTRIDLTDDNTIVERLIKGAREFVEKYINGALLPQTWATYYDLCDNPTSKRMILLPFAPVAEVISITTYNTDSASSVLSDDNYFLSGRRICLNDNSGWPLYLRSFDCMKIETVVGYEDVDSIPTPILEAMFKLIAHGYEHREAYFDSTDPTPLYANVPWSVTAMLQPYRIFSF